MIKKILFIVNYRSQVGGISGQVDILMSNLDNSKFETSIINTKRSSLKRVLLFLNSGKIIKNADILHIHCCSKFGGFFPAILGITLGKFFKKKIILTYHGGDAANFIRKNKKIVLFFLKKADEIIVLSSFLEKVFSEYKLNTNVIPNIFESKQIEFTGKLEILPNFISTRALNKLYNIEIILAAFSEIYKEYPNATLTILGDGTEKNKLIDLSKSLNLKNVQFIGKVPNFEVEKYLKKCDILLSAPSIDNFPISLLEAFDNEMLVVSSNVGGVPCLIDNYVNGLLFENKNVKDLVYMIKFALVNQEISQTMIYNAKLSLQNFTWEKNASKFEKIYLN